MREGQRRSEPGEFDRVYRAYRQRVLRWCLRYGAGSTGWAEDVAQEVFVKLHQHFEGLDRERDLGPWLYRATANLALSRLRRDASWWARAGRLLRHEPPEHAPAADEVVERQEMAQGVWDALGRLKGLERMVLTMKLLDGKSQDEIAAVLGLSKGYVSKLVARAWSELSAMGWGGHDGEA